MMKKAKGGGGVLLLLVVHLRGEKPKESRHSSFSSGILILREAAAPGLAVSLALKFLC